MTWRIFQYLCFSLASC